MEDRQGESGRARGRGGRVPRSHQRDGWGKKTRTEMQGETEPEVMVLHPKIRRDCVVWGGVQQVLMEEARWQVSGRKGVAWTLTLA